MNDDQFKISIIFIENWKVFTHLWYLRFIFMQYYCCLHVSWAKLMRNKRKLQNVSSLLMCLMCTNLHSFEEVCKFVIKNRKISLIFYFFFIIYKIWNINCIFFEKLRSIHTFRIFAIQKIKYCCCSHTSLVKTYFN